MKEKVYVGIDGGGTKTDFAAMRGDGSLAGRVKLTGCNPTVCGIGRTVQILKEGLAALDLFKYDVSGVFAGIAGCPDDARRSAIVRAIGEVFPGVPADAHADIMNVIYSTEYRNNCVAAICGTGSVAFAKTDRGLFRAGGWGPVFDEAGSGYDIGRDAIRAALAEEDGLSEHTSLSRAVKEKLGACVFDGAARIRPDDAAFVASFAPLVFAAAKEGDPVSVRILDRNFSRLAFLIDRAARLYGCGPHVLLAGGITAEKEIVGTYLLPKLEGRFTVTIVDKDPVFGALEAAKELAVQARDDRL